MPRTYLAGVLTATALSFAVAPALAETQPGQERIAIDISGIDLTTEAGTEMVLTKIQHAAKKACGDRNGPRSVAEMRRVNSCIETAVDTAVTSMTEQRARQAALKAEQSG